MSVLRNIIRGLRPLPGVGSHPGVSVCAIIVLCSFLVGLNGGGMTSGLACAGITAIVFLPILLVAALVRAKLSDRLQRQGRV